MRWPRECILAGRKSVVTGTTTGFHHSWSTAYPQHRSMAHQRLPHQRLPRQRLSRGWRERPHLRRSPQRLPHRRLPQQRLLRGWTKRPRLRRSPDHVALCRATCSQPRQIELSKSRDPSPPLPPPADPPSLPASPGVTPICSPRSPPHENLFLVQSSRILLFLASLLSQLC